MRYSLEVLQDGILLNFLVEEGKIRMYEYRKKQIMQLLEELKKKIAKEKEMEVEEVQNKLEGISEVQKILYQINENGEFEKWCIPGEPPIPKFLNVNSRKNGDDDIPYTAIPYDGKFIQKVTISPPSKDIERKKIVENILSPNDVHAAVNFSKIPLR